MKNNICLSIAGFDGSGGAGMQADLKSFCALGCYGATVLTAIPIQNTTGVKSCYNISLDCILQQLEAIFDDMTPKAIKIGMLFSSEIIELVANFLEKNASNIPIVLDPVMVAKSGDRLLLQEAIEVMKNRLLPISTIVTPNLPEAYELIGEEKGSNNKNLMEIAGQIIGLGANAVLMKAGHLNNESDQVNDFYLDNKNQSFWLYGKKIDSKNTHGTGCTLSAAICAALALGFDIKQSCLIAKKYLSNAMLHSKDESVGKGCGPLHHFYHLWPCVESV